MRKFFTLAKVESFEIAERIANGRTASEGAVVSLQVEVN